MAKNGFLFERKELKYLISLEQKESFLLAVKDHVTPDNYSQYSISNIYMDTPDYRLIRKSMEKPVYKEKLRLRSYGTAEDGQEIFIELKKKYKGTVYKRRIRMTLKEAVDYIEGRSKREGQIESEIEYFMSYYKGVSKAMFISYEREAYHGVEDPDLRITFDDEILWRDDDLSLSSEPYGNNLLDPEQRLLEIKCAGAMPLWLVTALSENRIYKTSFSKYGEAYMRMTSCGLKNAAGF